MRWTPAFFSAQQCQPRVNFIKNPQLLFFTLHVYFPSVKGNSLTGYLKYMVNVRISTCYLEFRKIHNNPMSMRWIWYWWLTWTAKRILSCTTELEFLCMSLPHWRRCTKTAKQLVVAKTEAIVFPLWYLLVYVYYPILWPALRIRRLPNTSSVSSTRGGHQHSPNFTRHLPLWDLLSLSNMSHSLFIERQKFVLRRVYGENGTRPVDRQETNEATEWRGKKNDSI